MIYKEVIKDLNLKILLLQKFFAFKLNYRTEMIRAYVLVYSFRSRKMKSKTSSYVFNYS